MIALLTMAAALAQSPCLDAVHTSGVPAGEPTFDIRPTDEGLELDQYTYVEWLWERDRLAGCLIELRASLAAEERTADYIEWVQEQARDAVKAGRPSWVQRNGFALGVSIGAAVVVALVAALAKTITISLR